MTGCLLEMCVYNVCVYVCVTLLTYLPSKIGSHCMTGCPRTGIVDLGCPLNSQIHLPLPREGWVKRRVPPGPDPPYLLRQILSPNTHLTN